MKIYILLDVYLNSEHHREFVDVFDSAEAVLKYISENQSDGHKFEYIVKEFQDEPTNPLDYPWTVPTYPQPIEPMYPGQPTYPTITWQHRMPCFNGGPCTNPQHDCIDCPGLAGGSTYTSSSGTGSAEDIKLIQQHRAVSGADSVNSSQNIGAAKVTVQAGGAVNFAAETNETAV